MKGSKKCFFAVATAMLATAVALPVTRGVVKSATAYMNDKYYRNDHFSQIENDAWLNQDVKSYYGASDEFPYPVATMEAWITLDENVPVGTDYGVVFSSFNSFAGRSQAEYEFRITADRRLRFDSGVDTYTHTFDKGQIPVGEKVHIAFIYDINEEAIKWYINGELADKEEGITLLNYGTYMKYRVGTNESGIANTNELKGRVHQVTVYGMPIDEETMALDMSETNITAEDRSGLDLMANWSITDTRAWTVEDTSGNGNDLIYQTQGAYIDTQFSENIDYSFVLIPDTQGLVLFQHERFSATVNWIKEKKDELNIAYVMHMGDIVNNVEPETQDVEDELTTQWTTARRCMSVLDGVVPYSFVLGNHDYDMQYGNIRTRDTNWFNRYFPYSKFSNREDFGGAFETGKMDNVYYELSIGNAKYLIFALEYSPRTNVLNWASDVIEAYPSHRVIITSHALLDSSGYFNYNSASALHGQEANDGIEVWDQLISKHPNVMMALGGHESQHNLTMRLDKGEKGNKVFSMLVDFQSFHSGNFSPSYKYDEAFVTVMGFDESEQKAYIYLVNAETNKFYNAQNCLVYDFSDAYNTALCPQEESEDDKKTSVNNEKGCGSSILSSVSIMTVSMGIAANGLINKRKKNED